MPGAPITSTNAYTSRFKSWLQRFKGVASKYLASYLGWRRMIEREGDALTSAGRNVAKTVVMIAATTGGTTVATGTDSHGR